MILAGQVLLPDPPRSTRARPGWLRVEAGRVAELHEGDCPHPIDLGGDGCLITPGFIDAHLHLPQFDIVGTHGRTLLDWLNEATFPAEARWADPAFAQDMTHRALDQLLGCGTTSFAAYATVHHPATLAAIGACDRRNLRCVVGQVLMDMNAPDDLCRPTRDQLTETAALLEAYPADSAGKLSRVSAAVTPRFALTCSRELLHGAGQLARQNGAYVQTHLAEMEPECAEALRLHPDSESYTGIYAEAGLLGARSLMGHCIYFSDAEAALLQETGSVAAHCPTANSFLNSGTMDRARLHGAGVRVALGSDIGGGYDRAMPRVARAMLEATRLAGKPAPTSGEAFWQITAGNADALGWPNTGRLQVGAEADLLVIQPDVPWLTAPDPLGMLLWAWDDRWLDHVLIAGEALA